MKTKLILQLEIINISSYIDIILNILIKHNSISINKLIVFAYLQKKNRFLPKSLYGTTTTNDVLLKCLSQLSGLFDDYCKNIPYIIKSIDLLIANNSLNIDEITITLNKTTPQFPYKKTFLDNAIEQSKYISDRQFLKEVVKYV